MGKVENKEAALWVTLNHSFPPKRDFGIYSSSMRVAWIPPPTPRRRSKKDLIEAQSSSSAVQV